MTGLILSLLDQTYPANRMEIIVVDNGSRDDTAAYVNANFPDIKCFVLKKNVGFAAGNNIGYTHTKHNFIVFLNQDTICHKGWLKNLVSLMMADNEMAACASNIIPVAPSDAAHINREAPVDTLFFCDLSVFGYGRYRQKKGYTYLSTLLVSGCAFIIRREIVEKLGYLFDSNLWMYAEDTDLSLRILNLGKKIGVVRDSIVFHLHGSDFNIHGAGLQKAARAIMNRVYVFLKNMNRIDFILFMPLMVFGGGGKIFQLNLPLVKKVLFFFPFSLFSAGVMVVALLTHLNLFFKVNLGPSIFTIRTLLRQFGK
jgi:GT2 family glycosyltransferase